MPDLALRVENLGKMYRIGPRQRCRAPRAALAVRYPQSEVRPWPCALAETAVQ